MNEQITPKQTSLKVNFIFNFINQLFILLTPLIITPYLSRMLLADGVGKQSFTTSIAGYFVLFTMLGIDIYGQKEIAKLRDNPQKASKLFRELFLTKAITSGVGILGFAIFIFTQLESPYLNLYLIHLVTIAAAMFDINWFYQGREEFKYLSIRGILIKLIGIIGTFIFVKGPGDVWIAILMISGPILILNILLWLGLPKRLVKVNNDEKIDFKRHFKELAIYFIPTISIQLYVYLDKTMILLITKSESDVGLYEQAEKIIKLGISVVGSFNLIMRSRLSYVKENNDLEAAKNYITKSAILILLLSIPMIFGYIIVAHNFVGWFLGTGFEFVEQLMYLFTPLILIMAVNGLFGNQYMIPFGLRKQMNIVFISAAILNAVLNIIAINLWGINGAVIVTLITEFFVAFIFAWYARKSVDFKKILKYLLKYTIVAGIMFGVLLLINPFLPGTILKTVLQIAIGITIYMVILLVIRDDFLMTNLKDVLNKIRKRGV